MNRVEQRLAELLNSAVPATQGVSFDEVAGRVRRRRAVRRSIVISAAAVSVVVLAGSLAGTRGSSSRLTTTPSVDLTGTIPWIDDPAPRYQAPTASPTPAAATDARPCTATDVTAGFADGEGAGGHLEYAVRFRNISGSTCVLKGYPHVTATEAGQPEVVGTDGSFFPTTGTANMPPGHATLLGLETDTYCSANPGGGPGLPLYHHVNITLPGGGTVALNQASDGLDVTCGLHVTPFFAPQPAQAQPEPHDPLSDLQVALDVPKAVPAGTTLTYVAALTNPTDQVISLKRCPGYLEAGVGPPPVKEAYALNCSPVHAIAPKATIRFEMRLHVPDQAPAGTFTFRWSLAVPFDVSSNASINVNAATNRTQAMCAAALHGPILTAQATTLGEARRTNIGGPYPGLTPGKDAFPGLPDNEPAAWCWTAAADPSPGTAGREWTWYVAVGGGRSKRLFTLGGTDQPPTGAPSIP